MKRITQKQAVEYCKHILVIYKHETCKVCDFVCSILSAKGYFFKKKTRDAITKKDLIKKQLCIVVAGDGTFLRVGHFMKSEGLLFGVNSDPGKTEGALLSTTYKTFEKAFTLFEQGKTFLETISRLETKINGKSIPRLAVNEVSISKEKPYHMYSYVRRYGKKLVTEKATGILVYTPRGSTAWASSAGGKKLPRNSSKIAYIIREPYQGKIYSVKKITDYTTTFTLISAEEGIIVCDSAEKESAIKKGDVITIAKAQETLSVVHVGDAK